MIPYVPIPQQAALSPIDEVMISDFASIRSHDGLLLEGTQLAPELILTYCQLDYNCIHSSRKCSWNIPWKYISKYQKNQWVYIVTYCYVIEQIWHLFIFNFTEKRLEQTCCTVIWKIIFFLISSLAKLFTNFLILVSRTRDIVIVLVLQYNLCCFSISTCWKSVLRKVSFIDTALETLFNVLKRIDCRKDAIKL